MQLFLKARVYSRPADFFLQLHYKDSQIHNAVVIVMRIKLTCLKTLKSQEKNN